MTATSSGPSRGLSPAMLLATAAELFARKGYRATTLDDVAQKLGVKKASLYHYIDSKEDLLSEIYQQIFNRIELAVAPIAELDLPADERLRRMVHAHIEVVTAERAMLAVAFQEENELPAESRRDIRHRKRAYESHFERVLSEGQRAGLFRQGSTRLMVLALFGMCNWIYQWFRPGDRPVEEIAGEFALILESGIVLGAGRRGAWPRYASVDDAFEATEQALSRTRAELDRVHDELARAKERLGEGLAGRRRRRREA